MTDPVISNDPEVPDPSPADPADPADTPVRPAVFEALLEDIPGKLSAETRAYYLSLIDPEKAHHDGSAKKATVLLADLMHAARTVLPFVVAGKVPGYGPLRLRYAVELGRELSQMLADRDDARIETAGLRGARWASLDDTRVLRRQALRVLHNLSGTEEEDEARVRNAAGTAKPEADERARSLENIAAQIAEKAAGIPADAAKDAGATPELLDRLREGAKGVLDSRDDAVSAHDDLTGRTSAMHVLGGRILREIRQIQGTLRDGRAGDPTLPRLRLRALSRRTDKAKKAEKAAKVEAPAQKTKKTGARKG
jgi:hypothetical protein